MLTEKQGEILDFPEGTNDEIARKKEHTLYCPLKEKRNIPKLQDFLKYP